MNKAKLTLVSVDAQFIAVVIIAERLKSQFRFC